MGKMITVDKIDEGTFMVTVESKSTTTHTVRIDQPYYERLTGGRVSAEKLVEKSFEFLLEREGNTSILRSFDLPVIGRYFPEYETTIRDMLE